MRYLLFLFLVTACSDATAPTWPPSGPVLHISNQSDEAVDISYRPTGRPDARWETLGQIPRRGGRCIRIAPIGNTVLRAHGASGEVRDSADLSQAPDWRWDFDLAGTTVLEPIPTICG